MIIQFKVKNFRSFKNEEILNFATSSKITTLPSHEHKIIKNLSVVKYGGIFGSCGFGKSTTLMALLSFINYIKFGIVDQNLSFSGCESDPTIFELVFEINNDIYSYSYSIKNEVKTKPVQILDEKLCILKSNGSISVVYSKDGGMKDTKNEFMLNYAKKYTDEFGRLFLSYMAAEDRFVENDNTSLIFKNVFNYITRNIRIITNEAEMIFSVNEMSISAIKDRLKKYDVGIENVDFDLIDDEEKKNLGEQQIYKEAYARLVKNKNGIYYVLFGGNIYQLKYLELEPEIKKLLFIHKGIKEKFSYGRESDGTKRILCLICTLFCERKDNYSIFIDEIERSCHPTIAPEIIRDFQKTNAGKKSQFVFTSHMNQLMNSCLRKDEIFLVDKDALGLSHIISLMEYRTTTRENVSKNYQEGRYGAVPKIRFEVRANDSSN